MKYIMLITILFIFFKDIKIYFNKYKLLKDLKKGKYFLKYQPIINCESQSIVAFEALLRTQENFMNNRNIAYLISNIEKIGMMEYYSLWLIKQVISNYSSISYKYNTTSVYISINVSIREIENKKLIDKFIEEFEKSNLDKNQICIEITEKHKFTNIDSLRYSIKRLRDAGYLIALDDFGVDYSNFELLSNIDFDIIKIDKCFVDDIVHSNINRKIIKSISDIYLFENKTIVIEGVENIEQNKILKNMNNKNLCIQGYLYYKPLDLMQVYSLPNRLGLNI